MRRKDGGFSLIEVIIGSVLLALLVGGIYTLIHGASSAYARDSAKQTLQDNARRVLDEISSELRDGQAVNLDISNSPSATEISFEKVTGFDAVSKKPLVSPLVRYAYEYSSEAGLGRIVRYGPQGNTTATGRSIICEYVSPNGFVATKPTTNRVDLSITLFTLAEGRRKIEVTLSTTVAVRN